VRKLLKLFVANFMPENIHKTITLASGFWGRCYDHNFSRFLPILATKMGVFLNKQCYNQMFAKTSRSPAKKRQFFAPDFLAKIF
jgi:hypothetical protein